MSYDDPNADYVPDPKIAMALVLLLVGSVLFLFSGSASAASSYAGVGALIAVPLCIGALTTMAWGSFKWLGCLGTPVALFIVSLVLVRLGVEGMACLAIAMPVWMIAALGGGLMSLWLDRARRRDRDAGDDSSGRVMAYGLATLPFVLIFAEGAAPSAWESRQVVRSSVVNASVAEVWPLLAAIPGIRADEGVPTVSHDWLGIPRPSEATLIKRDGQLVRLARWGRDAHFEERIVAIAPYRTLAWTFAFPDNSIQNRTDRHIDPDGDILKIENGRYDLADLGGGKTRLTLTTRYRMRSRLAWYFEWWGERFLGDVSVNVLQIVRDRAEAIHMPEADPKVIPAGDAGQDGRRPQPDEATSLHTLVQMVDGGLGLTMLPQMALDAGILTGTHVVARPLKARNATREIALIWRKNSPRREEFELLAEELRAG